MQINLKYFIPFITSFAFFGFAFTVSAVYICPQDSSAWPELGDCDLYCNVSCVEESQNQHKACQNNACVTVQGAGVDLCQDNSDCALAPSHHKACQNNACVTVQGAGVDLCQNNSDCQLVPSHHNECKNNACVSVQGAGTNQCQNNADCTGGTQPRQQDSGTGVSIRNPIGPGTFQDLVERIAQYLFQIGIPIAVIMILYAAFLYMTAGGSEEKVSKAHKALTYAVVGLAVLFLAWGITSLVKELLGGQ